MKATFPLSLDLVGTAVFALSGGLLTVWRNSDIVGIGTLPVAAGLDGGMIRDALLVATPLVALRNEADLLIALAAAMAAFFFFLPKVHNRL